MTRVEILGVICIALIAAYLVVRYQRQPEIIQLSWRKTNKPTPPPVRSPVPQYQPRPQKDFEEIEIETPKPLPVLAVTTNQFRPVAPAAEAPTNRAAELWVDWQRRKVFAPTNSVWPTKQMRRTPGVRIAYP